MDRFDGLSSERMQTETDLEGICSILECDTYSRKYMKRLFRGKEYVTALDILAEEKVDAFSRIHTVFALHFLSEKEKLLIAMDFVEEVLHLVEAESQKELAVKAIRKFRESAIDQVPFECDDLYDDLQEIYGSLENSNEKIVFEALLKPFLVPVHEVSASVAGCVRRLLGRDEASRLAIARKQVDYLVHEFR